MLKPEPLGSQTQGLNHTGHIKGEDINNLELFKDVFYLYQSFRGKCDYPRDNHLLI